MRSKSNCSDFEQLVALYVEEDLSDADRVRVQGHLKECSSCWDLAEDLKESQAVFKAIRQDVPNATALSALRERVLSEVGDMASMTWFERLFFGGMRRKAALASVALVMVGSGAVWLSRRPDVIPPPPAIVVVTPVPEPQLEPRAPEPAPKPVLRRKPAPDPVLVAAKEEPRQVAMKFYTDDPNVIIYWLVDEKGD
jgi:hypothetical protein